MKLFFTCLLLTLIVEFQLAASPIPQPRQKAQQKAQLTHLAHYSLGSYLSKDEHFLRVNVDKQVGGTVSIELSDAMGTLLFEKTLTPLDTTARLSIDLTDLIDGTYQLTVSNGLDIDVRTIQISTPAPSRPTRTITPL